MWTPVPICSAVNAKRNQRLLLAIAGGNFKKKEERERLSRTPIYNARGRAVGQRPLHYDAIAAGERKTCPN
jgi:hypothetical protein